MTKTLKNIWLFYYEGFKNMEKMGKTLWLIILLKLFVMFVILKIFFFPNRLSDYDTKQEKAEVVIENLTSK